MTKVFTILFGFFSLFAAAQIPVINTVTPLNTYPQNKLLISGSGFATNPAQMQVWFDQVKGVIDVTASSEFALTVTVPAQARFANIEVTNLVSGLSAKTLTKFLPFFSGTSFDPTKFAPAVLGSSSFSSGSFDEAFDVCTCDLDGDGKPDMAVTKNSTAATDLMLFKNNSTPGNISFTALPVINVLSPTVNITCGDLNGDGKPELVVNRGGATRNEIFVFRNTSTPGSISFAPLTKLFLDVGHNAFRVITRDLNADGKPEIIVSNSATITNNPIYIFINQSSGGAISFVSTPTKVAVTGTNTTYGIDSQDMDGDGKPEIIVGEFNGVSFSILKNTSAAGTVSFASPIKIDFSNNPSLNHLTTADFNNDGKADIAITNDNTSTKEVFVLLNKSTSSAIALDAPISLIAEDSPFGIDVADIDGDNDIDIIAANLMVTSTSRELSVFLNNGSASFTKSSVKDIAGRPVKRSRNLKVGDLDGDGKPDIAYTTVVGNSIDILRNTNCFVPSILNTPPLVICAGQTIRLNSIPSASATFSWQNAGNSLPANSNSFLDVTAADTYTVTATSESGSCSKTAAVTVTSGLGTVPADPTINGSSPVCSNGTISLSTTDVAAGYAWTGPNNFTSTQSSITINNATSDNAGNYTLQLASAGGCKSNITTKRVDLANLGNFVISTSVASNQVCAGSSLVLSANFANGYSYQWIKDGVDVNPLITTSPVTFSVTQGGVYKVRVTNIALGCNKETATVTATVVPLPVSSFTPSTLAACVNQTVTFTNNSTPATGVSYAWDFGDGTTSTQPSPSKIFLTAATRAVQLTVNYPTLTSCSNSSTKNIVVSTAQTPVINATVNPICSGDPSVLSVTGTFSAYAWTGPATGSSGTLDITKPGVYVVNTTESNGCTGTAQLTVTSKPAVTLTVKADDQTVLEGGDVLFSPGIPVQLLASGGNTFSWTPTEGLDDPAIANPKATPVSELTYTVTGSQTGLCNGTLSFNMKIDPAANNFYAPNAFSPNGDANNDLWVITNASNFSDCTISIFTKHGSKVFEQKGYTSNWDGTYEGKELPQGTYYYVLNCPDKKPVTGHILLAR